jgi:hypothetical protein
MVGCRTALRVGDVPGWNANAVDSQIGLRLRLGAKSLFEDEHEYDAAPDADAG